MQHGTKKLKRQQNELPAPEGPVGEDDIQCGMIGAIVEQRWRRRRIPAGRDDGPVLGVEHEFEVGDAARVAAEELENAPESEDVPGLEGAAVALHVGPAVEDDEPEMGVFSGSCDHFFGDAGRFPWPEVFMDPPEIVRAGGRRGEGGVGERWGWW